MRSFAPARFAASTNRTPARARTYTGVSVQAKRKPSAEICTMRPAVSPAPVITTVAAEETAA